MSEKNLLKNIKRKFELIIYFRIESEIMMTHVEDQITNCMYTAF